MKLNGRKFITKEEKDKRRKAVLAMDFKPEKKTRTQVLNELHDYHVNKNGHGY